MLIAKCQTLYSLTNPFTRETEIIPQTKTQIQQQAREKKHQGRGERTVQRGGRENLGLGVFKQHLLSRKGTAELHALCLCSREV